MAESLLYHLSWRDLVALGAAGDGVVDEEQVDQDRDRPDPLPSDFCVQRHTACTTRVNNATKNNFQFRNNNVCLEAPFGAVVSSPPPSPGSSGERLFRHLAIWGHGHPATEEDF